MEIQHLSPRAKRAALAVAVVAVLASVGPAAAGASHRSRQTTVQVMVVGRGGKVLVPATSVTLSTRSAVSVPVAGKACRVDSHTPLAALQALARTAPGRRLRPAIKEFKEFGPCAAGAFVSALSGEEESATEYWWLEVNDKFAASGAGNPAENRLRADNRVLFYLGGEGLTTLDFARVPVRVKSSTNFRVRVLAYGSSGKATAATGATVRLGKSIAVTNGSGEVEITVPSRPGEYRLHATLPGDVPAFERLIHVTRG